MSPVVGPTEVLGSLVDAWNIQAYPKATQQRGVCKKYSTSPMPIKTYMGCCALQLWQTLLQNSALSLSLPSLHCIITLITTLMHGF